MNTSILRIPQIDFTLDYSAFALDANDITPHLAQWKDIFADMDRLEAGGIANPDEKRMVGHYWLRAPERAPTKEIASAILANVNAIQHFCEDVHRGVIKGSTGARFTDVVVIGIGGSALGPQLVYDFHRSPKDRAKIHFVDNTDPEGMIRILHELPSLASTLVLVTSKSGGTKETRNGMVIFEEAFRRAADETKGLNGPQHFVAITGDQSELFCHARDKKWLATFLMWDWVGGRTSVMSVVGLLPLGLQGGSITQFLEGAHAMDEVTRVHDIFANPAALLAHLLYVSKHSKNKPNLAVLPYRDRLLFFSRYLQQLVMESIGKEFSVHGKRVEEGLTVFGNKGSTDQHAFVQQLRDGANDLCAILIEARRSKELEASPHGWIESFEVDPGVRAGDYLHGFMYGTREALKEKGRDVILLSFEELSLFTLGALIALFERVVGFYGALVGVNAYHQPGVEAGKKAAGRVLDLQNKIMEILKAAPLTQLTLAELIVQTKSEPDPVWFLVERLVADKRISFAGNWGSESGVIAMSEA